MCDGRSSSNKLIVVCGLSFAGKSTLADAICAAFEYPQVDVDETRTDLYGSDIHDEDLEPEEWTRIYTETDNRILTHLRNGESVVDASRNFRQAERKHARTLADRMKVEVLIVYVDTPEAIVRQRWAENRIKKTRRDVSDKGFEEIIAATEPPIAPEKAIVFKHDESIERWLQKHANDLGWERDNLTEGWENATT